MYVLLRRNDRLPIVAYAQWLLSHHPAAAGSSVGIDGIYGPQTEELVALGRFGSIELHGCRVARGDVGLRSLRMLAEETRVPVTAAYGYQMGGVHANRFEGPVRTVFPGAMTLPSWARAQVGYQSDATL